MDFFNNEQDNSKRNEELLDIIMEEQKRREKKHNIKTGYLLNKRTGKVSNPFERDPKLEEDNSKNDDRDFKHAPVNSGATGEPAFVVKGGTYHSNKKKLSKKSIITIISFAVALVLIAAVVFCCVYFLSEHKINIVCGNRQGITLVDSKNKEINEISLRLNEEISFKIVINENYSNSNVEVWYNNKKLEPNKDGYYTIKCFGDPADLRIMGVVENDYSITFDNGNGYNYYANAESGVVDLLNGQTKTNFFGNTLSFKVLDKNSNIVKQPYIAVYSNNTLLTPNEFGVFEVKFDNDQNITLKDHSPYEYFKIEEETVEDTTTYTITGLTEMGLKSKVLVLPSEYNDEELEYNFVGLNYYPNVEEIILPYGSLLNPINYNYFNDLQKITISENSTVNDGYYTENGLLYLTTEVVSYAEGERQTQTLTQLVKCPDGYGKTLNEGERIVSVNPDEICSYAFNKLNYIKTIEIGSNTFSIQPLALKSTNSSNTYTINFNNNTHFKVVNNIIYSYDESEIVAAPFYSGELTIPSGKTILENAFAFSGVTSLKFESTATLSSGALSLMEELKTIVMPSNVSELTTNMLFGNISLETIDLRNVSGVITISNNTIENWLIVKNIVVADEQLENYLTTYADAPFVNMFISVTEFDNQNS